MEKVRISGQEVQFTCVCSYPRKADRVNIPALQIELRMCVNGELINWYDFKDSGYLAEKISDYIKNTINGQRTFYWDANKTKED